MTPWGHRKRERLDGLSDLLIYAPGACVFDVGCHRGQVGLVFVNHGAILVHGCDNDPDNIRTARRLYEDVRCSAEFEVIDLKGGPASLAPFGTQKYDIVLLLGVYHKLRRIMTPAELDVLMAHLASRTKRFAWDGFEDEFALIDQLFVALGMRCVHRSDLVGHKAIWER